MARLHNVLENPDESDLVRLHETMIQQQIIGREITSHRTISAMRSVPRHTFMPHQRWGHAYDDRPQSIGYEQTISQPYIVSLMTSQFESLPKGSRILEIGSGCGYQTALLVHMGFEVHSIEIIPELVHHSQRVLTELSLYPASLISGDGRLGLPDIAPFSGILVAACSESIPETWIQQLATPGILIAPVEGEKHQLLLRIDRTEQNETTRRVICPVRFVKLH